MNLDSPIILIGTQRSGTTWLGSVFARHERLAYWEEPRHVWTWGNSYRPDDRLSERHARPRVVRHVRRTFSDFVRARAADRLVEKTPSNCLRIPFIHAIYPEARILLIVRDGRSVLRSTDRIMHTGVPTGRIWQRARQTPIWEWPAYAHQAAGAIVRKATRRPVRYWGPRPPDWRRWLHEHDRDLILARQWAATISIAVRDADTLPAGSAFRFRYEDLMAEPRSTMQQIVDFLSLPEADHLVDHVERTADPRRAEQWRDQLDKQTLERIRSIMEPTLNDLGYTW